MNKIDSILWDIYILNMKKFFRGKKWNKKQRKELEKQGSPPLEINRLPEMEFGIITEEMIKMQRICNLERSILLLILDFRVKRKEIEEKIDKLWKEVRNVHK